jgi:DME family drug/metabolite transporter
MGNPALDPNETVRASSAADPFPPGSPDGSQTASLRRGRFMVVLASLLWSTSGAFVKSPPLAAIPEQNRGPILACFRALAAAAALALFVRPQHIRWRPMLVPFVISFAGMNLLFVTAMTRTTAAAAIFLQYTSTAWAFVFSIFFLREKADRPNLLALAFALAGLTWIVAGDWNTEYFFGNCLALGSGLCYAGVIITLKMLRDEDSAWLVALCHAAAGLLLLPMVLTRPLDLSPLQWTVVAVFGVVQMGLPYVIFASALRWVPIQDAALLTLLEPILNPLWVYCLWGEPVGLGTWIGGGLIVGGLALRSFLLRAAESRRVERSGPPTDP